jgi:hypothetical protein
MHKIKHNEHYFHLLITSSISKTVQWTSIKSDIASRVGRLISFFNIIHYSPYFTSMLKSGVDKYRMPGRLAPENCYLAPEFSNLS